MADPQSPERPLIETELRHHERRTQSEEPHHGRHVRERRQRERRGRTLVRTGTLVALVLAGSAKHMLHHARVPRGLKPRGGTAGLDAWRRLNQQLQIAGNHTVEAVIDRWAGRPFFAEALARGAIYLPQIRAIFAQAGIPPDLSLMALVESEFKVRALSSARALGVWQFMPATGRRFNLAQDTWIDERKDPLKASVAAAQYLKFLYETFGDWTLAMAAYNAGEGAVRRAIDKHSTRDFWDLAEQGALPRETREYVPRIHAAILMARDPEHYNIEVPPPPQIEMDVIRVSDAVDLSLVARCLATDVSIVLQWNPELQRLATPAHREFDLKVPVGTADSVAACLEAFPAGQRARFHIVRRGDTLKSLAKRYGLSIMRIAQANAINPRQCLGHGTELIIPAGDE